MVGLGMGLTGASLAGAVLDQDLDGVFVIDGGGGVAAPTISIDTQPVLSSIVEGAALSTALTLGAASASDGGPVTPVASYALDGIPMSGSDPSVPGTLVASVTYFAPGAQDVTVDLGPVTVTAAVTATGIVFGADTPVGSGGTLTALADGNYGQFTASGGVLTPRVSPLTLGVADVGGETVAVIRQGDKDITVTDEAELIALAPHTLSTAQTPDATVRIRAGAVISTGTDRLFGGGWPRPTPVAMHGMVTVIGEGVAGVDRTTFRRFSPNNFTGAAGVASDSCGIILVNCDLASNNPSSTTRLITMERCAGATFAVEDCDFHAARMLDPFGDYGAKMDYSGASGLFQAGEKIASPEWTAASHNRTIIEVRDKGNGTGTLVISDGTNNGQSANRARAVSQGATLTGNASGATATVARKAYTDIPDGGVSGIGVTGNPRPDHIRLVRCRGYDLDDVFTLKANQSVLIEDCEVDRYTGDAFTVSPNKLSNGYGPTDLTLTRCRVRRPVNLATDLGNPHNDGLQVNNVSSQELWGAVKITLNQFMDGQTRGTAQQMFIQGPGAFRHVEMWGNIVSGKGQVNSLIGVGDDTSVLHNNTLFKEVQADGTDYPSFNNPQITMNGPATYRYNVASAAAQNSSAVLSDNSFVKLDGVTGPVPITDVLTGPFFVADWGDQFLAAKPAPGANSLEGARGTPVNWATHTISTTHLT